MKSGAAPWYGMFGPRYNGDEGTFYAPEEFPWTVTLEENWRTIREEILALLERDASSLKPYPINKSISFPPRHWKTMGFYFWKLRQHKNCRTCPRTVALIDSIPNMTAAALSVLEPGSNIYPHQGDTDAIVRCHLGLSVPADLPDCGFQVGGDIRPWRDGETLIFCDAHTHAAWNQTDTPRLILIVDVVREEYASQVNLVCSRVLAALLIQMINEAWPWFNKVPGPIRQSFFFLSRVVFRVLLPVQRRLGTYV